eukprot:TRINITY_DN2999_c0_g2_i1.p1 TRINITY_DN2999_c0_g2~~TRINITY_DN2999_c0_g2_i1.p1  ORF type:complete len:268 (+),score=16.75 TRINITY_DN2999_c0_g2_i1:53-856(+)
MEKNTEQVMKLNQGIVPNQNNGQFVQPSYGTAQPHQQNPMRPNQGSSQPYEHIGQPLGEYQQVAQMGVPLAQQPLVVIAGGNGVPVPQMSDEQLAQMAKNKRFRFSNGQWNLTLPTNPVQYIFLVLAFILSGVPVGLYFLTGTFYVLVALVVPVLLIVLIVGTWGTTKMTFDDRERTIYHKTKGLCAKRNVIKYSDCVRIYADRTSAETPGRMRFSTWNNCTYSLETVDGKSYLMFFTPGNLEEASLNAFLRERLAANSDAPIPNDK